MIKVFRLLCPLLPHEVIFRLDSDLDYESESYLQLTTRDELRNEEDNQ